MTPDSPTWFTGSSDLARDVPVVICLSRETVPVYKKQLRTTHLIVKADIKNQSISPSIKAEWIWGVLAELEAAGLIVLADKGYQGAAHAKLPYRGKNKPESQKTANRAHAKLRSPGERANAQLKA
jgi:hypothetical protein